MVKRYISVECHDRAIKFIYPLGKSIRLMVNRTTIKGTIMFYLRYWSEVFPADIGNMMNDIGLGDNYVVGYGPCFTSKPELFDFCRKLALSDEEANLGNIIMCNGLIWQDHL